MALPFADIVFEELPLCLGGRDVWILCDGTAHVLMSEDGHSVVDVTLNGYGRGAQPYMLNRANETDRFMLRLIATAFEDRYQDAMSEAWDDYVDGLDTPTRRRIHAAERSPW